MGAEISKARARKSKTRRQGNTAWRTGIASSRENLAGALLVLVLFWLLTTVLLKPELLLTGRLETVQLMTLLGDSVFLLVALFASVAFLLTVKSGATAKPSSLLLFAVVSLFSVAVSKGVLYLVDSTALVTRDTALFLLPLALAPLLATILLDCAAGIAAGIWTSLAISLMADCSLLFFVMGIVSSVVAAQAAWNIRTRLSIFRAGLLAGIFEAICVFGFIAINWQNSQLMNTLHQWAACFAGGVLAAMLVMLFLPLFEGLFRVTSNITLLELCDMGHPLLHRLAMEAPGTYHHSLVVASLAYAAADEIGANSMLARVCAYYHDIGKLAKPDFFSENMRVTDNPHNDLPPSMSTLIITSHVKEGAGLAMAHKLPEAVIRVILEHHGTGLVSYFHHKARSRIESDIAAGDDSKPENGRAGINENDFRYPGPKPQMRESVIICIADAVEAASRTLQKTSPAHIEDLVNEVTASRLDDDQFSDADITLAEIASIKRSLVFNLANMLHGRTPYPKDEDRDNQPAETDKAQRFENHKAG